MNKIVGLNAKSREMLSELISELKIESYKEGFEAGRKYGVVEGKNEISRISRLVHDKIRAGKRKSPNQQRAELILKAKEFVKSKRDIIWDGILVTTPNNEVKICNVEFIKKATESLVY